MYYKIICMFFVINISFFTGKSPPLPLIMQSGSALLLVGKKKLFLLHSVFSEKLIENQI